LNPATIKNKGAALLTGLLLCVPGSGLHGLAHAQESLVSVDPAISQDFTQTVPILGRLVAQQSGTVASRIAGPVDRILVQVGDQVTRGQPIAVIDSATLALQKTLAEVQRVEARTRIETAKAQLELARQEVKRLSGLKSSAAVSKAALDDAIQQQKIAISRVSEAEATASSSGAAIQLADLELQYANILAPYNGTITAKLTEVGSYLQRGAPVVQLISDDRLELEADVPNDRLAGLTPNREVEISVNARQQSVARVRAIVPEENPRTRTRRVRFEIELAPREQELAVDQSVTVHVPAGASRQILSVHKDAIIRGNQGTIVYVVEEGMAKLRPIQTGAAAGNRMEVLEGLADGDLVVVRGNERLQPDQPVSIGGEQKQAAE